MYVIVTAIYRMYLVIIRGINSSFLFELKAHSWFSSCARLVNGDVGGHPRRALAFFTR